VSKTKMRCVTCSKWFQSANAKEVTCPECTQKARKEKLATKNAPPVTNKSASVPARTTTTAPQASAVPKPKQVQGGTNQWLDKLEDVKIAQPDQPPVRPKIPSPPVQRDTRNGSGDFRGGPPANVTSFAPQEERTHERGPDAPRGPSTYRSGGAPTRPYSAGQRPPGQRPRQPMEGGSGRGPFKPGFPGKPRGGPKGRPKMPRPSAPPRPQREKFPPPPPFTPTPEQVQQVEERYLELAQPAEFDGIRTQIAKELKIPKVAVKKIVKELRSRQNIPSWWELQAYQGNTEELEKIKEIYEPYLPVPQINIHKKIADELALKPGIVYQAIKKIRQELGLPQYNDPALHAEEFAQLAKERDEAQLAKEREKAARLAKEHDAIAQSAEEHEQTAQLAEIHEAATQSAEVYEDATQLVEAHSASETEQSDVLAEVTASAQDTSVLVHGEE
jgi:hypothetical protein